MIELRQVGFVHDDARAPVLHEVDLEIEEGELVLVAGRTGIGKSTLLGVVPGLVPRFTGGTLSGDVVIDGVSVIELPPRERAHLVGYVGQDPVAGFVTDTVEEELAYGMEQLGLAPSTMRRRVEETLDLLGIADLRARDLSTLSGGQQQRVAIGSVLAAHPRLLVLDEPTSALDPTAAEEVLASLTRLVHDVGLSVLLAEHRLERVVPFADRTCLLTGDGGVIVGETAEVLRRAPVAPPIVELGRDLGWDPLPLTVRAARRLARRLPLADAPDPRSRVDELAMMPPGGLSARGVSVVRGRRPVVHDVDIDLAPGTVTALMGRNGAGKSSLIWALQGARKRTGGKVGVTGGDGVRRDPAALGADERVRRIGLVPQSAADLLYLETVAQECAAADAGADAAPGSTAALLETMVPGIDADHHPRDLSEGQRLALVLAVVLVSEPPVVLLDEPTRGLDYPAKAALGATLRRLAGEGRAVLVASHDVEFVARVADHVVVMAEGEVVSSGPVREVLAESPSFAPQVTKIVGPGWLTVDEVVAACR